MKVQSRPPLDAAAGAEEIRGADYAHDAGAIFERTLAQLIERWESTGVVAPRPEVLVDLMFDTAHRFVPAYSELADLIGPFYDTNGAMRALGGVSKQAVDDRRRKSTILAARTSDGRWVYPVFQFRDGTVDRALIPAFRALAGAPAWSAALWFVTANDDLDESTPLDWARCGSSPEVLQASARRTAAEWV